MSLKETIMNAQLKSKKDHFDYVPPNVVTNHR